MENKQKKHHKIKNEKNKLKKNKSLKKDTIDIS